ncbi:MAG: capsule biosynthesis protein [Rhodobacteraceae bacterium]|nr:capsule biosynthesis protein [Paracoccaceae bacterium]
MSAQDQPKQANDTPTPRRGPTAAGSAAAGTAATEPSSGSNSGQRSEGKVLTFAERQDLKRSELEARRALVAQKRDKKQREMEEKRADLAQRRAAQQKREKVRALALKKAANSPKRAGQPKLGKAGGGPNARTGQQKVTPRSAKPPLPIAPPAKLSRPRSRHWTAIFSLLIFVGLPILSTHWYLTERAADRYASLAGFSVRTEDVSSAVGILGMLVPGAGGSSSSDTDILYQYIQSQELVRAVDNQLDLRNMWSKADPEIDPIFSYHPPGTIEDLVLYWQRMVSVYNDSGTGLINIEVQAFTAEDAHLITQAIYDESSAMINRLSAIAQADATDFAQRDLANSVELLKVAREALTRFRNRTQIVDPAASIQSQMGLLSSLQYQLAETLIDLDIIRQTASTNDPRVAQAELRVAVIEARMEEERSKLGIGTQADASAESAAFADLIGEYERLVVDLEFAQQRYTGALINYDGALAKSQRQSRYLAAHVNPTTAESAVYPRHKMGVTLVGIFAFLIWSVLILASYAIKDRR